MKQITRRGIRTTFPAAVVIALAACSPVPPPAEITAAGLEAHIRFLAADDLAGRETGTPGIARAEDYIVDQYKMAGLKPPPGRLDYFLEFPLYEYGFDPRASRCTLLLNGEVIPGAMEDDFEPLAFSADGFALGQLVYAGYGITAPEYGWDDYAGLDVQGKIAVIYRHEPARFSIGVSRPREKYTRHAFYSEKIANAAARGARAVLFVTDPYYHETEEPARSSLRQLRLEPDLPETALYPRDPDQRPDPLPVILLRDDFGKLILDTTGHSPAALQRDLDNNIPPRLRPLTAATALLTVRRSRQPRAVPARNTAAFLPGNDPLLKDEWIVIGAHHDHIGADRGQGDAIYNGADDNASGVSGVLALTRALAGRPGLRHSLLFVTFSAEEEGLLGSDALFDRKLLPAKQMKFMCNLDMIGRNPDAPLDVYVRDINEEPAAQAAAFLKDKHPPTRLVTSEDGEAMSDDYEFSRRGIPSFFFFSGLHPDYHGVNDEADRIAYPNLEARVRLIRDFILWLDTR